MNNKRNLATSRARSLRKEETKAEESLWRELRGRRPDGLKFRRQHPVTPYIIDFAERSFKLAIEIDGPTDSEPKELAYDLQRTNFLKEKGWTVIRFTNTDVYEDSDSVVDAIWKTAMDLRHEKQ